MTKLSLLLTTALLTLSSVAPALTVTEPPDHANTGSGTTYLLGLGQNILSGTIDTSGDDQDSFQVSVPTGMTLVAVSKTTAGGTFDGGSVSFNTVSQNGLGTATFGGLPLGSATYPVLIRADFSTGTSWSLTFTVENSPTIVTTAADEENGSLLPEAGGGAGISLREAALHSATGTRITFDPSLSGHTLTLVAGQLSIDRDLIIDATALPRGFIVNGNNASRQFTILPGRSLTLRGLTLLGGNGTSAGSTNKDGGAIRNDRGILTLSRCTISGNSTNGGVGGAIWSSGTATLSQCTLTGNSATGNGGAIWSDGPLSLSHCTLAGNSTNFFGGAIRNFKALTLANTLAAGNSALNSSDISTTAGAPTVIGVNLIGNLTSSSLTAGLTVLTGEPLLAPLADYGGSTPTMALRPGSPARDAATGSTATTDQRGLPVVGTPDIGAFEAGTLLGANLATTLAETLPSTGPASRVAPAADFDGDGASNQDETGAGTNLTDPLSVLRITQIEPSGESFVITFPSVAGKSYTLWQNDTLLDTWNDTAQPAIVGSGSPQIFTVPAPPSSLPSRFYRVQVNP